MHLCQDKAPPEEKLSDLESKVMLGDHRSDNKKEDPDKSERKDSQSSENEGLFLKHTLLRYNLQTAFLNH